MKKRTIVVGIAALAAVGLLAGCGKSTGKEKTAGGEEQVVLKWQSWDPVSKYQPVIDAYEKANPNVKIEYEQVSDYLTKIFTEASSDELPDLISCQVGYTQAFADAGILEEVDIEELKSDENFDFNDFWETTLNYATYEDKYYGLPVDGGNYAWAYNKKMFDQLGIEVPEDGYTWDEFLTVCQQLMKHKDELGIDYATLVNDYGMKTVLPYIWQNGVEYAKCNLDDPKAIEAVQFLVDLYDKYKVIPPMEKLDEGSLPIVGMLNSGSIAMGRVALWEALKLEDNDKLEWQLMPAPYGNNGDKGEVLYVNTLSVASSSEQKEQALDFMKFITGKEGLKIYLENTSDPQISVRKSLKDVSIAPFDSTKNAGVFVDELEYCKWMPSVLSVNDQLDAANRQLDRIYYDGESVDSVMKDLAKEIDKLF
ncbi:sugar ABC transporter substrate-binding protein [Muricomes intestini]|uniref:ABC transporter substrate-binding protein n=1 Tax=Muricomes intestini TaxID=1796634 RepID=UPI002FE003A8